jgi:hypothetical protein
MVCRLNLFTYSSVLKSISVSDRLAYLNFVQGSLAASVAGKLDSARVPLKAYRDAEVTLQPKRNIRTGMQTAIGRLESEQVKGNDRKIAEMREALKKAEAEDEHLEKDLELMKRKALKESEQIKWDALREVWCVCSPEVLILTGFPLYFSMARNLFSSPKRLPPSLRFYRVFLPLLPTPILAATRLELSAHPSNALLTITRPVIFIFRRSLLLAIFPDQTPKVSARAMPVSFQASMLKA